MLKPLPPHSVRLTAAALLTDQLGLNVLITGESSGQAERDRPPGYLFRAYSPASGEEKTLAMTFRPGMPPYRLVILSLVEARQGRPYWVSSGKAAFTSRTIAYFGENYHYGLIWSREMVRKHHELDAGTSSEGALVLGHYPETPRLWYGDRELVLPGLAVSEKLRQALFGEAAYLTEEERRQLPGAVMQRLALTLVPAHERAPHEGRYRLARMMHPRSATPFHSAA